MEDIHASKEEEKELIDDALDIGGEEEQDDDDLITTPNEWADPLNTTGNDNNPVEDLLVDKYDTDQRFLVYTEAGPYNHSDSDNMKADIMNKPSSRLRFEKLRAWLNMFL